jgi:hypothetical protein
LSRLERGLDADGLLRHWLAEAKGSPDLTAYATRVFGQPEASDPFGELLERVEAATRRREKGSPPETVRREVAHAKRTAMNGMRVVLQLNVEAEDQLIKGGLAQGLLMYWLRELTLREHLAEHGEDEAWMVNAEGLGHSWEQWRRSAIIHLEGLYEAETARRLLEERHVGGHDSLLPRAAEGWRDLVERSDGLYAAAMTLREADDFESLEAIRERAAAGAEAIAERIVGMASLQTHWAMGDRMHADAAVKALLSG